MRRRERMAHNTQNILLMLLTNFRTIAMSLNIITKKTEFENYYSFKKRLIRKLFIKKNEKIRKKEYCLIRKRCSQYRVRAKTQEKGERERVKKSTGTKRALRHSHIHTYTHTHIYNILQKFKIIIYIKIYKKINLKEYF